MMQKSINLVEKFYLDTCAMFFSLNMIKFFMEDYYPPLATNAIQRRLSKNSFWFYVEKKERKKNLRLFFLCAHKLASGKHTVPLQPGQTSLPNLSLALAGVARNPPFPMMGFLLGVVWGLLLLEGLLLFTGLLLLTGLLLTGLLLLNLLFCLFWRLLLLNLKHEP